jgi:ubiquinone/menaquinone biosynthesis C-methylase UbiE/uncharacterized protein YbaR (Trm112 family)
MTNYSFEQYVCPKCKGKLQAQPQALRCSTCQRLYPITNDIPDFLLVRPQDSANPLLRDVSSFKTLAGIYETALWYPLMLKLLGGAHAYTFKELISYAKGIMSPIKGLILDIATGTGTYGRHVTGRDRTVYGIDISMDMMQKGQVYAKDEGVTNMNFARADVEVLPFGDNLFDGCFLCGSIHTFPAPLSALAEINRTLRPGAPILITTLTWGKGGILKYQWMRNRVRQQNKIKILDLPSLQKVLAQAGFESREPEIQGSLVALTARKM